MFKRLFACFGLAAALLMSNVASATTIVTGNIKNLGTGVVGSGSFVRFYLRGCAGNQPRVNGTAIIAPTLGNVYYFDIVPNSNGSIPNGTTLYSTRDSTGVGPGEIECGGSLTAVWYGMQPFLNGRAGPETPVHAFSGVTLEISTVAPITAMPVVTAAVGLTQLTLPGSISGFTTVRASPVASGILTLPAATDTLVGQSTTDTLLNKTLFAATLTGTTLVGAADTGFSRIAGATLGIGNGTAGDTSGTLRAASLTSTGSDLTISETGDQLATVKLHMRNRTGANGALVENPGQSLGDFAIEATAAITNIAIDGANNLTVTAAFASGGSTLPSVGQTVTLTGLTTATFLNNQVVTIGTISATQFTASFTHSAYTSAADTGTATIQINLRGEFRNDQVTAGNTSGEFQVLDPTNPTNHWLAVGKSLSAFTGNVKAPTLTFPLQTPPANPPTGSITIYGDTTSGQITCRGATGISCLSATAAAPLVTLSPNPAQTGVLRAATGDTAVAFRNNANTGDISALAKNTSDVVIVGGSAGISASGYQVNGSALSAANLSNGTTGSGAVVLQNSPTLNTPNIGAATASSIVVSGGVSPGTANLATQGTLRCSGNQACAVARTPDNTTDVQLGYALNGPRAVFGSVGGSTSGVTAELGHLQVDTGVVNNGAGMMHVRATSCTTPAAVNGSCVGTVTWPGTWADTNYTVVCTSDVTGLSTAAFVVEIDSKTTTTVRVGIENAASSSVSISVILNCIGIHD